MRKFQSCLRSIKIVVIMAQSKMGKNMDLATCTTSLEDSLKAYLKTIKKLKDLKWMILNCMLANMRKTNGTDKEF